MFVRKDATDDQLVGLIEHWIDILANEDYEAFYNSLGFAMLYQFEGLSGPESIKSAIESYRSVVLYPGEECFKVSHCSRTAGGNSEPVKYVARYEPNSLKIKCAISYDLPLNGKWSDLGAEFVVLENSESTEYDNLSLEGIGP